MNRSIRILGMGLILLALLSLGGCSWLFGLFGQAVVIGPIAWDKDATEWRDNTYWTYTVTLPAGIPSAADVWGTDVYTDDSSIGSAAVHAGHLNSTTGGTVKIQILPGRSSYNGSTGGEGIVSQDYGAWDGSFKFLDID